MGLFNFLLGVMAGNAGFFVNLGGKKSCLFVI